MEPFTISPELTVRLLAAAKGLGGARRLEELLERLRPALRFESGTGAGLCLYDEERRLLVVHLLSEGPARAEHHEFPVLEALATLPGERSPGVHGLALASGMGDPLQRLLAARGHTHVTLARLDSGEHSPAALFVAGAEPLAAEPRAYLADLAHIVEAHVWNCFTHERFRRGDQRRDALRELSRVINTSLDLGVVLHLARTALGTIEGHRASWIGLLEPGGATWLRHDRPLGYSEGREPVRRPVAGSVLARLFADGRNVESEDLHERGALDGDEELRAQGVRRYVATPLRAGGKVLGAFLFGSDDPHPFLRVDVWLLENIAVQMALAIHNAQHYEEIQRLSARRERENLYLREELRTEHDALGMLGESAAMQRVRDRIVRVAPTGSTVLISGPTGVGKELVARAIHECGAERGGPLVRLNCAAIPEGMVESELFGHERGAFTSAVDRRIGRFELAQDGTLFLDEIGELSLAVQAKLLRVLQGGEFERVGGTKTLVSNARILAATNRDLEKSVAAGTFRSDLYYRLNVFPIEVPSLEQRREDVALLAQAFVEHFARRMGKRLEGFEPAALAALAARSWPGNVRELKHLVERAVILSDGPRVTLEEGPEGSHGADAGAGVASQTLGGIEAAHIRAVLARTGWVVEGPRGAAALLGLKGATLRFRMKRLGIRRPAE